MESDISFNNGFITAITLFLEHKLFSSHIIRDVDGKVTNDLRLYGATDHLYEIEIPESYDGGISNNTRKRIISWRNKCFKYRLGLYDNPEMTEEEYNKITDELFEEAENIIIKIDNEIFPIKKVQVVRR